MMEALPGYISIVFILTTFLTVGFLLYSIKQTVADAAPAKVFSFLLSFWIFFQAIVALSGFYQVTDTFPPRVFAFGLLPTLVLMGVYFAFFRRSFIEPLSLRVLTLLHVIRVPIEFVLLWLAQNKLIPYAMTFEGTNFDILSGLTAPIVYWLAFRGNQTNRTLLIVWNIAALLLLINVVTTAMLAFPSPMQQIAFDQPNRAVTFFPFIWLPTVVVPIVFFSHLVSLWKLFRTSAVRY